MKIYSILFFLTTFLTLNTVSALEAPIEKVMSAEKQLEAVEEIAKNLRRGLWIQGYEDVHSSVEFIKKDELDAYVKGQDYESNLDQEEVSSLYKCYYGKTCELYLVGVSGTKYGGYGSQAHFILYYPKSGKHFRISHTVYAE